jgi:hypothetical protein
MGAGRKAGLAVVGMGQFYVGYQDQAIMAKDV